MFTLGAGCQGVPPGGKTKAKGCLAGGSGAPFFIRAWEVCLKCAAPGAASGAPHSPHPHPKLPGAQGWQCWAQGAGAPAHGPAAVRQSPPGSGEKFGGVAVVVCAGREVAPGDVGLWAGGPAGG